MSSKKINFLLTFFLSEMIVVLNEKIILRFFGWIRGTGRLSAWRNPADVCYFHDINSYRLIAFSLPFHGFLSHFSLLLPCLSLCVVTLSRPRFPSLDLVAFNRRISMRPFVICMALIDLLCSFRAEGSFGWLELLWIPGYDWKNYFGRYVDLSQLCIHFVWGTFLKAPDAVF